MASIAPLMTKVVELKKLHYATNNIPAKYIIVNKHTLQKLVNEADSVGQLTLESNSIVITGLEVAVKPQDVTRDIVMEVV